MNKAEYQRVHKWVALNLGKADHCSADRIHKSGRFHWSNISHQYKYELTDWQQLCPTCHKAFDGISDEFREIKRQQSMGNQSHAKPILQLFGSGSWVKYPSTQIASDRTGANRTSITSALSGNQKTAGGFRWLRVEAS